MYNCKLLFRLKYKKCPIFFGGADTEINYNLGNSIEILSVMRLVSDFSFI